MEYDYDENEFLIEDTRCYIVLVIYDITDELVAKAPRFQETVDAVDKEHIERIRL